MSATRETELRSLGILHLHKLCQLLNDARIESWKILMGKVKLPDGSERFSADDMLLIEMTAATGARTAAEIFLDEWSSMGRKRPTVGLLLDMLIEENLLKAADYLTVDVLKSSLQPRPVEGPACAIEVRVTEPSDNLLKDQNSPARSLPSSKNLHLDPPRASTSVEPEEEISDLIKFSQSIMMESNQMDEMNSSEIPLCIRDLCDNNKENDTSSCPSDESSGSTSNSTEGDNSSNLPVFVNEINEKHDKNLQLKDP